MTPVLVVGGGLAGLVAAERATDPSVLVLEREQEPGGACRTVKRDGFLFDHTAHLLHVNRPETEAYLRQLGVWDRLEVHQRRAGVVVGGRVTPYPIQIHTHGLAPEVRRDCLLGFIRAWAGSGEDREQCFRDWVLGRFGDGFARHFFFPYNSKLYRARPEELSLDWVDRYVPRPRLEDVVDGALGLFRGEVGYNAVFRYPERGGIELLAQAVAERLEGLRLGAEVVGVHLGEGWLELADGERIHSRRLVSTVPLPCLFDMLVDTVPEEVTAARSRLRWVAVVNLALGVGGPAPRPEHWLYYPDPELPFYRVGFPSNHGRMAPEGCHTVSVEVSVDPSSRRPEGAAAEAERALVELGLVEPEQVLVRLVTVLDPAYVVYDDARQHAVATLHGFLARHGAIVCGRWAEWKYSAMEDAILDGMTVARRLGENGG